MKICHKELRESRRWLRWVQRMPLLKPKLVASLVEETEELVRIFAASLRTAQGRSEFKVER
jgi:four helix bundle protein